MSGRVSRFAALPVASAMRNLPAKGVVRESAQTRKGARLTGVLWKKGMQDAGSAWSFLVTSLSFRPYESGRLHPMSAGTVRTPCLQPCMRVSKTVCNITIRENWSETMTKCRMKWNFLAFWTLSNDQFHGMLNP